VLVPIGSVALRSNTPTSKAIVVSLVPSRAGADVGAGQEAHALA
jgi:hypothetical protein